MSFRASLMDASMSRLNQARLTATRTSRGRSWDMRFGLTMPTRASISESRPHSANTIERHKQADCALYSEFASQANSLLCSKALSAASPSPRLRYASPRLWATSARQNRSPVSSTTFRASSRSSSASRDRAVSIKREARLSKTMASVSTRCSRRTTFRACL